MSAADAEHEYGLKLTWEPAAGAYDLVVLAVSHGEFLEMGANGMRAFGRSGAVLYDVKSALPRHEVDGRL